MGSNARLIRARDEWCKPNGLVDAASITSQISISSIGDDFHFIHQIDVDRAKNIFEQLGHFGRGGAGD